MARTKIDLEELRISLATADNNTLATRFNVSAERIRQLRRQLAPGTARQRVSRVGELARVQNNPSFLAKLGSIPDADLAQEFGVTTNVVFTVRRSAGKASHAQAVRDQIVPYLGTMMDKDVATKFGYSVTGVTALRERMKIAPFADEPIKKRRNRKKKVVAAVAPPTPVPATVAPAVTAVPAGATDVAPPSDTMEFLQRRFKAGDSTEALASRLEMTETKVRAMLGLA